MTITVPRPKLNWRERLYLPAIVAGLAITLKHFKNMLFGRTQVTMQYPEQKWDSHLPDHYRGAPALVRDAVQSAEGAADVVITTGGTGITARDTTFEAIQSLLSKRIDGFGELFRALSFREIGAAAMLSRATAGAMGRVAIFSLPGSEHAVRLAMTQLILPEVGHVVRELRR